MRKSMLFIVLSFIITVSCSCAKKEDQQPVENGAEQEAAYEKGYDLPIEDAAKEEAEGECIEVMGEIREIYIQEDKGEDMNAVISDAAISQMREKIREMGESVTGSEEYPAMDNHQNMEDFLLDAMEGQAGDVILYVVDQDGGIRRKKYVYDGADMYVLSARAQWDEEDEPMVTSYSYTRLKEWRYTEKGWFLYNVCVPEPPEVSEVVDGSYAIRIRPLSDACRQSSEKYVRPLGYQGNNLLCIDWDGEDMEDLDYNGLYEYLYRIKYQDKFRAQDHWEGIPAEQFEQVITDYLPVTAEQLRQWAVFDAEQQTYGWAGLGCTEYVLTYFGNSLPEVTEVEETADGTITLTVDAVCRKGGDDAALTHELTVRPEEDGSFTYLGNKIVGRGLSDIPTYQYRVGSAT